MSFQVLFQEGESGRSVNMKSGNVPKVSEWLIKTFFIGSGWLASFNLYSQELASERSLWDFTFSSPVCCLIKHTFILVISTNSDNSKSHICILIDSDFIQPLSKDWFVVIDVADENPHIRCVCKNDSNGRRLNGAA